MDSFVDKILCKKRKISKARSNNSLKIDKSINPNSVHKKPKLQQSFLDLGQKSFGKTIHCQVCNFYFVKGDVEDEISHRKHCQQTVNPIELPSKKFTSEMTLENGAEIVNVLFEY